MLGSPGRHRRQLLRTRRPLLLATRLTSRIQATFGVKHTIRTVFEAPTVSGLAERLNSDDAGEALETLLPLRPQGSRTRCSACTRGRPELVLLGPDERSPLGVPDLRPAGPRHRG
ncbi:phosphopantetheine-binding protein [Streptomyces sp. M10(2022)]